MLDQITNLEGGLIHHGKQNNRLYVMKPPTSNINNFIKTIEKLAIGKEYGKIIVKVPDVIKDDFINNGYTVEAKVPNFYLGKEDCSFVSKYMSFKRRDVKNKELIKKVVETAHSKKNMLEILNLEDCFTCRKADKKDVPQMVPLYKKIFSTYPFPIHEESYIEKTMEENLIYFGIWHNDSLIALSSSEIDWKSKNAEMTDFAVDPNYRGRNISSILLNKMEKEMKNLNISLVYTIARSVSFGMNCTFAKNKYEFAGTLFNNTQIAGNIESMNVWYKEL